MRVQAAQSQAEQLIEWARAWHERTWAVEGATGLGRLLAEQLVTAGEQVFESAHPARTVTACLVRSPKRPDNCAL